MWDAIKFTVFSKLNENGIWMLSTPSKPLNNWKKLWNFQPNVYKQTFFSRSKRTKKKTKCYRITAGYCKWHFQTELVGLHHQYRAEKAFFFSSFLFFANLKNTRCRHLFLSYPLNVLFTTLMTSTIVCLFSICSVLLEQNNSKITNSETKNMKSPSTVTGISISANR